MHALVVCYMACLGTRLEKPLDRQTSKGRLEMHPERQAFKGRLERHPERQMFKGRLERHPERQSQQAVLESSLRWQTPSCLRCTCMTVLQMSMTSACDTRVLSMDAPKGSTQNAPLQNFGSSQHDLLFWSWASSCSHLIMMITH